MALRISGDGSLNYLDATFNNVTASGLSASGNVVLPSTTEIGEVSSTELGFVDGVTSGIQSQLNSLDGSLASKADVSVDLEAKTADYTLVLSDAGKLITVNSASAETVTIPLNSSVAFPVGTNIAIAGLGAGAVDIQGASGVTINSTAGTAPTISAQYAGAQCYKIATDTWLVIGSIQ
jgi:hypothetical protein